MPQITVALFIPCYIDQFYPGVAIASLELLENLGCKVYYPAAQTCCGQPMANAGFNKLTKSCSAHFVNSFSGFDYIVSPSGSCVLHIKEHLSASKAKDVNKIRDTIYELTDFLISVLKVTTVKARFAYRVGLHISCHGQRMLHLASMSEKVEPFFSKAEQLLSSVTGLELCRTVREDECCGFGGTFCVTEEAVSIRMGRDRIMEHEANEVEYITGGDSSCLMHLEGILKRKGSKIKVIHLAQILVAR